MAALFGVNGKADTDALVAFLMLCLLAADLGDIDHSRRCFQRVVIIACIEFQACRSHIWHFRFGHEVLLAQFIGLYRQMMGEFIHHALDGKTGARPCHAAIGAHGRLVGGHSPCIHIQPAHAIGARQIARSHAGFHEGTGRP
jgi:hypothetical protein